MFCFTLVLGDFLGSWGKRHRTTCTFCNQLASFSVTVASVLSEAACHDPHIGARAYYGVPFLEKLEHCLLCRVGCRLLVETEYSHMRDQFRIVLLEER